MKHSKRRGAGQWLFTGLLWLLSWGVQATDLTSQAIALAPGWNAIFMELSPDDGNDETQDDDTPARVFDAVPEVQMVWAMPRATSTVQYITNPGEISSTEGDWRVYIPASQPTAALTNLFAVASGHVYLVKLAGSENKTLTVQGRPGFKRIQWQTESFNLVGFYADPDPSRQATFADYLGLPGSSNPSIFTLSGNTWTLISKNAPVEYGRGYWVYNDGTFNSSGPLEVVDNVRNGLNFGETASVQSFEIVNRSKMNLPAVSFAVSDFPLQYFDGFGGTAGNESQWADTDGLNPAINIGKSVHYLVAVDRLQVSSARRGLLTLQGGGMRIRLPLRVDALASGYDGLWVGTAVLNEVSNVNATDPLAAERTPAEMTIKLLLHSAGNQVYLLKQVYLLGDYSNPDAPLPVLVTDDQALPHYIPLEVTRGENRGHRLSSAAFDFAGTKLALTGTLDSSLSGVIDLDPTLPTHPLKHRRNPDHDNLRDDNGTPLPATNVPTFDQEVWTITRQISMQPDNHLPPAPSTGMGEISGVYQEVISGLHKKQIVIKGRFNLQRVSQVSALDPEWQ